VAGAARPERESFICPGAFLLTLYLLVAKGILRVTASPVEVNWFLDRVWVALL
jgi:hypothetical protein